MEIVNQIGMLRALISIFVCNAVLVYPSPIITKTDATPSIKPFNTNFTQVGSEYSFKKRFSNRIATAVAITTCQLKSYLN